MEDWELQNLIELIPQSDSILDPKIFEATIGGFDMSDKKYIDLGNNIRMYTDIIRKELDQNILPEKSACGNIELLKMYILNQNQIQQILKESFNLKVDNYKQHILKKYPVQMLLEDCVEKLKIKKTKMKKITKILTENYVFETYKKFINLTFDGWGLFEEDIRDFFNQKYNSSYLDFEEFILDELKN